MVWCGFWSAAEGFTFLCSGRPLPGDANSVRYEGVDILLDERATEAWREAGENGRLSARGSSLHI